MPATLHAHVEQHRLLDTAYSVDTVIKLILDHAAEHISKEIKAWLGDLARGKLHLGVYPETRLLASSKSGASRNSKAYHSSAIRGVILIIETFIRIFVDVDLLDRTILFYEELLNGTVTLRFAYPDVGLELAAVSSPYLSVLVISGLPDQRAPFEATRLTIQVDRLEPYVAKLREAGAEQLQPVQKTPVGYNTRFRHLDGLIVEYVEHDAGS